MISFLIKFHTSLFDLLRTFLAIALKGPCLKKLSIVTANQAGHPIPQIWHISFQALTLSAGRWLCYDSITDLKSKGPTPGSCIALKASLSSSVE